MIALFNQAAKAMTILLQRIIPSGAPEPRLVLADSKEWNFTNYLAGKGIDFFQPLVRQHKLISFEYSVICTRLAHDLYHSKKQDDHNLIKQVQVALACAELLEILYRDYLNVPREIMRLQREQIIFRECLKRQGFDAGHTKAIPGSSIYIDNPIHDATISLNWLRLLSVRSRRLLVAIGPLTHELSSYRQWVFRFDQAANPVLTYIAWLFFTPRLLVNLSMIAKHAIPGFWLSEKAIKLGWQTRLIAELNKRWFELGNDFAWLISGLVNCFILTGPLLPYALYVSVSLQGFDMVWASIRALVEMSRLSDLDKYYQAILTSSKLSQDERQEIKEHERHLQIKLGHEQKTLLLGVLNTSVLFIAICLALPALAYSPLVPVIGASIAVLMTLTSYSLNNYLKSTKPADDISGLKQYSFFRPTPSSQNDTSPTHTNPNLGTT